MKRSSHPEQFFVFIGGYTGTSYQLELKNDKFLYTQFGYGYKLKRTDEFSLNVKDWESFLKTTDAIGIWQWTGKYRDPGILDGTSWKIQIKIKDKQVSAEGSNAYPGGDDGQSFSQLLSAVQDLIGNAPFS